MNGLAPETDELRERYVMIGGCVRRDSRGSRLLGAGMRILFVAACDGRELVVYDSLGRRRRLAREDVSLGAVYDETGKKCRHAFDEDTGHLLVLLEGPEGSESDEEEETWLDCFPWQKYDPAAREAVSEALEGDSADDGAGGLGLPTPELVF